MAESNPKSTPAERWAEARETLLAQLTPAETVNVLVPGWQPIGIEDGLNWLRATIFEGYYVKSHIEWTGDVATVAFKFWEFGDPEPA